MTKVSIYSKRVVEIMSRAGGAEPLQCYCRKSEPQTTKAGGMFSYYFVFILLLYSSVAICY